MGSNLFYKDPNGQTIPFDDIYLSAKIFQEGTLWSWGLNNFGQLGIATGGSQVGNPDGYRSVPVTVSLGAYNWRKACAGTYGGIALQSDGALQVWGGNNFGQLGISNPSTGNLYGAILYGGTKDWRDISDGATEGFAGIRVDGSLWIWGRNDNGQLGIGTTGNRSTPVTTFAGGNNWKQVSMGWKHTVAIKSDGTLWVWGSNLSSRLGIGTTSSIGVSTPITTFAGGNTWKQVACGYGHVMAIKTDGTLWGWGRNTEGQIGIPSISSAGIAAVTIPQQIEDIGYKWKQVSCGAAHCAAIAENGSLWAWGANDYGQIGNDESGIYTSPWQVGTNFGSRYSSDIWRQVACGYYQTSAVKSDGTLWVWGRNNAGQIGIGITNEGISTPVTTIAGGTNWKAVACGPFSNFTLATKYDGTSLYT